MLITEMRPIMKGITVASVSIVIPKWGNFFIKSILVFSKDGERWISFPSDTYEKDGVKKYARKCGYEDRDMQKKFEVELLKAFDEYVKDHPLSPPEPKQQQIPFGGANSYIPQAPAFDDPWY